LKQRVVGSSNKGGGEVEFVLRRGPRRQNFLDGDALFFGGEGERTWGEKKEIIYGKKPVGGL